MLEPRTLAVAALQQTLARVCAELAEAVVLFQRQPRFPDPGHGPSQLVTSCMNSNLPFAVCNVSCLALSGGPGTSSLAHGANHFCSMMDHQI